jgi:hypothetical protein
MVQAGPNDPLCCPSQHVIKSFSWEKDNLVEVSSEVVEDSAAAPQLVGPLWTWQQSKMSDGMTWEPRNRGVRADHMPDPYPEIGVCVHKLGLHRARPEVLYQQNHCGVYRSDDGGSSWTEITGSLPSEFGFPMVAHPRDPATAWVIPLNGADRGRFMPDAAAAVWRTRDRGASWERLAAGLPQEHAYLSVLREALAIDRLEPVGVFFGTSNGELWASADAGVSWTKAAADLPDIWSVEALVLEG